MSWQRPSTIAASPPLTPLPIESLNLRRNLKPYTLPMCTLSVITNADGYLLAMNRDESIHRAAAAPPSLFEFNDNRSIYPRDSAGGTWIAVNQHGIALALLNWNDVPAPPSGKQRSRGEIIPALVRASTSKETAQLLEHTPATLRLNGLLPFRLIAVFPNETRIVEWCWNNSQLVHHARDWKTQQWFSSSKSDADAAMHRGRAYQDVLQQPDAGTSPWLRRLHSSHADGPAFSVCVHREGVRTLSYSEITCVAEEIRFFYSDGSPCATTNPVVEVQMARARRDSCPQDLSTRL